MARVLVLGSWLGLGSVAGCLHDTVELDDGADENDSTTSSEPAIEPPAAPVCEPSPLWPYDYGDLPAQCTPIISEQEFVARPVRVYNFGIAPIYLAGPLGCQADMMDLRDTRGRQWPGNHCKGYCDEVITEDECGCLAACFSPPMIKLMPGGSFEIGWAGYVLETLPLPEGCGGQRCGPLPECYRAVAPAEGPLRVTLAYSPTIECEDDDDCDCTPNLEGWCDTGRRLYHEPVVRQQVKVEQPLGCSTLTVTLP